MFALRQSGLRRGAPKLSPERTMLTLEDCIALSDLTEEEILAIAEHEHIPEMAAAELGNYLVHAPDGARYIKAMIRDDIAAAAACGNRDHALALKLLLRKFIVEHPLCDERCRQELHIPDRRRL
jgi:hypothetical protein